MFGLFKATGVAEMFTRDTFNMPTSCPQPGIREVEAKLKQILSFNKIAGASISFSIMF